MARRTGMASQGVERLRAPAVPAKSPAMTAPAVPASAIQIVSQIRCGSSAHPCAVSRGGTMSPTT